jgi:3-dehydroquinate synthase
LPEKKVVIVTDEHVDHLYKDRFPDFPKVVIGTGESVKNFATVEKIIRQLIDFGLDRHGFLLGIGGGIVCDITGFVASIFMRGISFGFVSSTLLSQVDASVGGKNGVNFDDYKNLVGNFNQPDFVIGDLTMLKTLPEKEIKCGMGEVVKHALIKDQSMLSYIEEHSEKILNRDEEVIEELVYRSVKIKAEIVNADEKEKGERKKLNFGHTLAHAIEKHTDLSHGEAVSIGMMFAANASLQRGLIDQTAMDRIQRTLLSLGLPVSVDIGREKLAEAVEKDKKKHDASIDFVFLKRIGEATVNTIPLDELKRWIKEWY